MYVRTTLRKNKDGSVVRYLQLAHNTWDPVAKRSRAQVIYNFGREDVSSRTALERLAGSLSRFLSPEPDPQATLFAAGEGFEFLGSRPLGGSYALDGLWQRLGIDAVMRRLLKGRRRDERAERVLFALVANRALAPSSKLAATRWICEDVHIAGLAETTDDACYRAMDWLLEIQGALEKEVFHEVASLLSLEVDLVEDLLLQRSLDLEEPVHGPVAGVVRGLREARDVHVLADPARGRQLGGRGQSTIRDQREEHALGALVAASPFEQAPHDGVDSEALPEPVQGVAAAQRPRPEELEALAGGEQCRLGIGLGGEEARERAREALQRRPARCVLAAEVVDHLGARALRHGVPRVVGELQVADDRAVLVLARCRAHVHGLDILTQPVS